MSFQLGRITLAQDLLVWRSTGASVTVTGGYTGATAAAALVARDQLLGYYNNPDEPVIPVISTGDSRVTGFYRVAGVDITTPPETLINGHFEYAITLEPIAGFAAPAIESFLTGALMTNGLAVVIGTTQPFHAVPVGPEYSSAAGALLHTRPILDASGQTLINWWLLPTALYKTLARYSMPAAIYYAGACTITNLDTPSHVVVGQQEPLSGEGVGTAHWQLSNGLVKVSYYTSAGTQFIASWVDGTNTYRTTYVFTINSGLSLQAVAGIGNVRILRNSPEEVIIRCPIQINTFAGLGPLIYIDISLRRGSRIVRFYCVATTTQTWSHSTGTPGTPMASTAITGGLRQTANDANGNRVVVMTSFANTTDLVNGNVAVTGARLAADFGISMELAGSAAVIYDTAQEQVYQYLAAQAERMQVVGR